VDVLDPGLVREARLAFGATQGRAWAEPEQHVGSPGTGQAILGELLAIFPGVLVPGLGHYYAGDTRTAHLITRVGLFGEGLILVGGGTAVGGYYVFENSDDWDDVGQASVGATLVILGGATAVAGLVPFLTAWWYDMIDTPRAVLSGGQPAPNPEVLLRMDVFGPGAKDWDEP
jgi:hypothetical protein